MDSKEEKRPMTGRLDSEDTRTISVPSFSSYSRMTPDEIDYKDVPFDYKSLKDPHMWRVFLKFGAAAAHSVIGLDIYGDVILGRGESGPYSPDVNLNNLEAFKLGVSRRHAMLRPTQRKLFLIDLDSTNGTFVNAMPVGRGMAQSLQTGDTVALAGLSFEIQVIKSPGDAKDVDESNAADAVEEEEVNKPVVKVAKPRLGQETILPGSLNVKDLEAYKKKAETKTGVINRSVHSKAKKSNANKEDKK